MARFAPVVLCLLMLSALFAVSVRAEVRFFFFLLVLFCSGLIFFLFFFSLAPFLRPLSLLLARATSPSPPHRQNESDAYSSNSVMSMKEQGQNAKVTIQVILRAQLSRLAPLVEAHLLTRSRSRAAPG